jgi:hypothetical protein
LGDKFALFLAGNIEFTVNIFRSVMNRSVLEQEHPSVPDGGDRPANK